MFFHMFNMFCGIFITLGFGVFEYTRENLWIFELEGLCIVCCKVWIAVVYVAQHISSFTQVFQALDASMYSILWE